jgi:hypothetical protein
MGSLCAGSTAMISLKTAVDLLISWLRISQTGMQSALSTASRECCRSNIIALLVPDVLLAVDQPLGVSMTTCTGPMKRDL